MRLTHHARKRFDQRFPDLNPAFEWANARRVGKRLHRKLGRGRTGKTKAGFKMFSGRYYLLSRGGVIFVVAPPETVITVLKSSEVAETPPPKTRNDDGTI